MAKTAKKQQQKKTILNNVRLSYCQHKAAVKKSEFPNSSQRGIDT